MRLPRTGSLHVALYIVQYIYISNERPKCGERTREMLLSTVTPSQHDSARKFSWMIHANPRGPHDHGSSEKAPVKVASTGLFR